MEEKDRIQLAALRTDLSHLIKSVDEIKEQIQNLSVSHITRETFDTLKSRVAVIETSHITKETFDALRDRVALMEKIVFGALGVVLITVLGAIVALVVRR